MPCKKENCKCFKCGKIADKEVDKKLLSNSSTSDLKLELVSDSQVKRISNDSSDSKSNFVVYKTEYPHKETSRNSNLSSVQSLEATQNELHQHERLQRVDEESSQEKLPESEIKSFPKKNESNTDQNSKLEIETKVSPNTISNIENQPKFVDQKSIEIPKKIGQSSNESKVQEKPLSTENQVQNKKENQQSIYAEQLDRRIEKQETEVQAKHDTVDGHTSPFNLAPLPPVCSGKPQLVEDDDVPVRKFSIGMREDVDKPLHPLQHHESNNNLPLEPNIIEDNFNSDDDDDRSPEKGYAKNKKELKAILQLIVDASDKILNTLDKAFEKSKKHSKKDDDDKKGNKKEQDDGKAVQPFIYNVHNVNFDSSNPVTINLPLHLHFNNNGNVRMFPMKPTEIRLKPTNNIKTSSESVNIHYPKTPYKSLSSEFVITENVLVNGYTDEIPIKDHHGEHDLNLPVSTVANIEGFMISNSTEISPRQTVILNKNQLSDLDLNESNGNSQIKKHTFKDSEVLNDKVNLKLPVNFPQQRNIKVCVPCYCDNCPLFDNDGNLVCPEQCGCCTCAYTINEANPEDRTELELCRCTSKTQFNTIGRSYVSRCQCSRRVDLCPCRDKYGSLGEQVPEFDDDKLKDIKKRRSTRISTLRISRLSKPLLQFNDDSPKNENTTTTTTTPTTDDTGRNGDDEGDRRRMTKSER